MCHVHLQGMQAFRIGRSQQVRERVVKILKGHAERASTRRSAERTPTRIATDIGPYRSGSDIPALICGASRDRDMSKFGLCWDATCEND
jgi:hypothetical protein